MGSAGGDAPSLSPGAAACVVVARVVLQKIRDEPSNSVRGVKQGFNYFLKTVINIVV